MPKDNEQTDKPIERDHRQKVWLEFLAVKDEIKKLQEEGYSATAIHEYLRRNGKITMVYV